jgi:oligosaccharide repeat unit polymerase
MRLSLQATFSITVLSAAATSSLVFIMGNSWDSLIAIAVHAIIGAALKDFNPLHPSTWLVPFIYLYNFSIFILEQLGVRDANSSIISFFILWSCLAVSSIILSLTPTIDRAAFKIKKYRNAPTAALWIGLIALSILINYLFLTNGYIRKSEAVTSGISQLYPALSILVTVSTIFLLIVNNKINYILISSLSLLALISTALITGERNFLFSYIIAVMMICFIRGYINTKQIMILATLSILAIPLFGSAKLVFQKGGVELPSPTQLIVGIFNGEFRSAGSNFDVLVRNSEDYSFQYGSTFVSNVARSIIPSFIARIPGPGGWFNDTFYAERRAQGYGMGFTLFGEGYLNFGTTGALLMAAAIAAIAGYAYRQSQRSTLNIILYIGLMPLLIYGLRADVANILSPFIKALLLPALAILLISTFPPRDSVAR